MLAAGIIALAAGTYAFRWAGPALRERVRIPARGVRMLEIGAVVLLAAVVAVTTLPIGTTASLGFAMPAGVLVGGVLAWYQRPILLVMVAAAATAALLRSIGVP
ncbi:AzlD domain-containing protein [Nocardia gamkensis]|uniref:AzlD domain-containing protein n=1 Tax=Nocardia gamkensis TaxID=352869 RepID=UPI0037CB7F82